MTLKNIFKTFYGVKLEAGPNNTIAAIGIESLPEDVRKGIERWLEKYRDHTLERLRKEK